MPRRPATAARCNTALVDPETAIRTRNAFSTDFSVMISEGLIGLLSMLTAALPDSSAATSLSAATAGIAAVPGSDMPNTSAIMAIVEAVPITAQVPAVEANLTSTRSISSLSISPARYRLQKRLQSVQAPSRSPRWRPVLMGPVTS